MLKWSFPFDELIYSIRLDSSVDTFHSIDSTWNNSHMIWDFCCSHCYQLSLVSPSCEKYVEEKQPEVLSCSMSESLQLKMQTNRITWTFFPPVDQFCKQFLFSFLLVNRHRSELFVWRILFYFSSFKINVLTSSISWRIFTNLHKKSTSQNIFT